MDWNLIIGLSISDSGSCSVYTQSPSSDPASRTLPPVAYKGKHIGTYAADLVVDGRLLVETKCVEHLTNEHLAQCINYLKASGLHLALLINFRKSRVEWRRVVHDL